MAITDQSANLRLAAKILAELRVPWSAPEYQRLLQELLTQHPNRDRLRALIEPRILCEDASGTILWYLSETLSSDADDLVSELHLENVQRGPGDVPLSSEGELRALVAGKIDQLLWSAGPEAYTRHRWLAEKTLDLLLNETVALLICCTPHARYNDTITDW